MTTRVSLRVEIDSELRAKAKSAAALSHRTLNEWVETVIREALESEREVTVNLAAALQKSDRLQERRRKP